MKKIICVLLLLFSMHRLMSQEAIGPSTHFDMTGFPQWTRNLRRASIVAFGSFPFTYFFTNFSYDLYRCSTHNWNRDYAPWPVKGPGAVEQTNQEKIKVIGVAAGGAIMVALTDFIIEQAKRKRSSRRAEVYPEGTPIIIRRPLNESIPDNP